MASDLSEQAQLEPFDPSIGPLVITGEVVTGMPGRKELILVGKAALADVGVDPDDLVDARTEEQMRRAVPENTRTAMRWAYGFLIKYCGVTGRKHDPANVSTIRHMISDSFHMVGPDGKGPGRYGRPYAPATIELVVYAFSMICDRLQWVNPARHPFVAQQLRGYAEDYAEAGHSVDKSDALTHDQSVVLARSQDLGTVQGLRNAAMMRGQFDLGCRADEWCKVLGEDLTWLSEDQVLVTFRRTKGRKARTVPMEAAPAGAAPLDPARLLLSYYRARRSAGWSGTGPLWVEVRRGDRRKDFEETGILAGRFTNTPITYTAYAACFNRAVTLAGIAIDPVTKKRSMHFTTHSNRIGMIDAAVRNKMRVEDIAPRTGHSYGSKVIYEYLRHVPPWGSDNPGVAIRRAAANRGAPTDA
jgi:hypothetical protein